MKKQLMILVPLILIAALVTGGAFAYFSSARSAPGQIASGTLNLQLSEDGTTWGDTASVWDVSNMAPGDTVEGKLWMMNTGSIDARQVTFEWSGISDSLADHIFLVSAYDSKNTTEAVGGFVYYGDSNGDGKCSLAEVAALSTRYGFPYDAASDDFTAPFLQHNVPQWLYMKFQFDPEAGNEYQGRTLNYGLVVTAWQKVVFPALVP